jgi:hypothetical protein
MTIPRVSITIDPGGNSGGGGGSNPIPPPHGNLYWYADDPSSYIVNDDTGAVESWGSATSVTGTPYLITDSVTGRPAIRFDAGVKLSTVVGAGDFLTEGDSTAIIIGRTTKYNNATPFGVLDNSGAGAGKGYQLQIATFLGQHFSIRVNDGADWILDAADLQGQFIEQKWFIAIARLTPTKWDLEVDGQFVTVGGTTISIALPGATGRALSLGNGLFDLMCVELYNERLSDDDVAEARERLALRFGVDTLQVIGGDPTLTTDDSALFPYLSKLPNGRLYATMFRGSDENPHNTNFISARTSANNGATWSDPVTLLQSDSSLRYSDVHTSEPLSDGQVFQHWFVYDSADAIQTYLQWRKSTSFDVDGNPVWSSTTNLPVAGVDWIASGAQMVENPDVPGQYHLPAFGMQTGDTHESIFDLKSANSGASWTPILMGDGEVDTRRYAEPALLFDATSTIICMARVVGAATAYVSRSTNSGTTWAAFVNSTANFVSSAQGFRKMVSGRYIAGPARVAGSFQESAMFWRGAGTLWNSAWTSPPDAAWVDPFFGGNYYGGNYEVTPGKLTVIYGRASAVPQRNNVSVMTNFYEWYFDHAMPGDADPDTATVTVNLTQLIALSGAGGYTCTFDTNASGADVIIAGEHATYTAGPSNGTDIFHFDDCNGKTIKSCTYTVSGGVSGPTVSSISPDAGVLGMLVTITGSGFSGASGGTVGGVALTSFTVVNPTTITGVLGTRAAAGGLDVVITNGSPGTLAGAFTYLPASLIMYRRGDAVSFAPFVGWLDLTTEHNDAAGSAFDPTPATVNGHPAVHFAGSSDILNYSTFTAGLTALDYFVLAQNDDDGATAMTVSAYTSDNVQPSFTPLSNRQLYINTGSDTRYSTGFAPAAGAWAQPWLLEVVADTSYDVNFNGAAVFGPTANTFGYLTVQHLGGGLGTTYEGSIAQEMMFSARLSGPDRAVVTTYLTTYGGIA